MKNKEGKVKEILARKNSSAPKFPFLFFPENLRGNFLLQKPTTNLPNSFLSSCLPSYASLETGRGILPLPFLFLEMFPRTTRPRILVLTAALITGILIIAWYLGATATSCGSYVAISESSVKPGVTEILLEFRGESCAYYGEDIRTLKVVVTDETKETLHVKIVDPHMKRWEVPEEIIHRANRPVLGELRRSWRPLDFAHYSGFFAPIVVVLLQGSQTRERAISAPR